HRVHQQGNDGRDETERDGDAGDEPLVLVEDVQVFAQVDGVVFDGNTGSWADWHLPGHGVTFDTGWHRAAGARRGRRARRTCSEEALLHRDDIARSHFLIETGLHRPARRIVFPDHDDIVRGGALREPAGEGYGLADGDPGLVREASRLLHLAVHEERAVL